MLKELRLTNIVLVENATIIFAAGFNVLSGESGSGKSAIMNALSLIAGDRSDSSQIRRGADKGIVEAIFDIDAFPMLADILNEAGIDHETGCELFLRRELSSSGKSRAFINNQLATLNLLKQVSDNLFDVVGQHANQKLRSLEYHRNVLDLFGEMQKELVTFAACWEEETTTRKMLEHLVSSEAERMRDIEICSMEIEELLQANLKEGEEEELFAEYSDLTNADELAQKTSDLTRILNGDKIGVLGHLSRNKSTFEQLVGLAPALKEAAATYNNALIELQEVAHTLSTFESRIEHNPQRADQLNERLALIVKLKRKYGATLDEIKIYLKTSQEKLSLLENADTKIEELQDRLNSLSAQSNILANQLTAKRTQAATLLQKAIINHLRALNMPKVEFHIDLTPQKRSKYGDDKIEFFITPNIGEHRVSLRECASGGELSRTMLAIQALLAGKEKTPTLVFDEIDANIGGATASVVGEKLYDIGRKHQVLCITHFPQVAKLAGHHLNISKQEIDGRTVTLITSLDQEARQHELTRMLGFAHATSATLS